MISATDPAYEPNINFNDWPQPSFFPVFDSRARYLIIYGSAGAGKSYSVAQKLLLRALIYPHSRIIAIRKYGPSLRITSFKLFCDLIDEKKIPCNINKTDMSIHFPNGSTIQCIPIVNTASGEAADRIKSLTDSLQQEYSKVMTAHAQTQQAAGPQSSTETGEAPKPDGDVIDGEFTEQK